MRRKDNLIKLGDAINQIFKNEKLDLKISRFSVKNSWREIVGDLIANNTTEMSFSDKALFLTLKSAPLKQELSFNKQEIIDKINHFCGYKLISDIVFK